MTEPGPDEQKPDTRPAPWGQPGNGRGSPIVIRTRAQVDPAGTGGKPHVLPWEISGACPVEPDYQAGNGLGGAERSQPRP